MICGGICRRTVLRGGQGGLDNAESPSFTVISDLPHQARRSITCDPETKFVSWPHLQAESGTQAWFCDPLVHDRKAPSKTQTSSYLAGAPKTCHLINNRSRSVIVSTTHLGSA